MCRDVGDEGVVCWWSGLNAAVHLRGKHNCTNPNSDEQTARKSQEDKAARPDITEIERVTQEHPNAKCEEAVPHEVKELEGFLD
jgi:hypothetical protein